MALVLSALLLLAASEPAPAQPTPIRIQMLSSETLSLFYFAQTLADPNNRSPYLRPLFEAAGGDEKWVAEFREALAAAPSNIEHYQREEKRPTQRYLGTPLNHLFEGAALMPRASTTSASVSPGFCRFLLIAA